MAFIIFINDIDCCAEMIDVILKFADDTKAGHQISADRDRQSLQTCLDNLVEWADKWQMQFNISKCKVMHIGRGNPMHTYYMSGIALQEVSTEKDIGVLLDSSLKPSKQCAEAARRANAILGEISRAFHFRDRFVYVNLYKKYVRCHMEFSVSAWCPWSVADKEALERVQRRAVAMVSGLTGTTYKERLEEIGLMSLETRRIRFDMIETFKMLNSFSDVDYTNWFNLIPPTARQTRSNIGYMNLERSFARTQVRENFFSVRVPPIWNSLPDDIKKSRTIQSFKKQFDIWAKLNGHLLNNNQH